MVCDPATLQMGLVPDCTIVTSCPASTCPLSLSRSRALLKVSSLSYENFKCKGTMPLNRLRFLCVASFSQKANTTDLGL